MTKPKIYRIILLVILILQVVVLLGFGMKKQGYFIDEIYSYGLSNGNYKPFVVSYDVFDRWIDQTPFHEYMTVQEGEQFDYGSVYYNQTQDVHPPLYYMVLHTVCSFFSDQYSKWMGIGVNLLFFALCNIFIYLLGKEMLAGFGVQSAECLALAAMALWGFSAGGITTAIYIRMYMLLTLFTVIFMYHHVRMVRNGQGWKQLLLLFVLTAAGLLTQYYFVIIAFYTALVYGLYYLFKKQWKRAASYGITMFAGVAGMVIAFPACITHLTRQDEFVASETRNNVLHLAMFKNNIVSYISNFNQDFLNRQIKMAAAVTAGLIVAAGIYGFIKRKKSGMSGRKEENEAANELTKKMAFGMLLITVFTFTTIAVVAVVPSSRYIYNLYPLCCILAVWLIGTTERFLCPGKYILSGGMVLFLAVTTFGSYLGGCVQYLYPDEPARMKTAENCQNLYCLYINDYENAPLTEDLRQLELFAGVYITPRESIQQFDTIFAGKDIEDGIILYVDTNGYWSSGYDAEEVIKELAEYGGFTACKHLYGQELSQTFLLYKE